MILVNYEIPIFELSWLPDKLFLQFDLSIDGGDFSLHLNSGGIELIAFHDLSISYLIQTILVLVHQFNDVLSFRYSLIHCQLNATGHLFHEQSIGQMFRT